MFSLVKERVVKPKRRRAFLTVDFEDYRSITMRDYGHPSPLMDQAELEKEACMLLELFESLSATATFFCVGHLVKDLGSFVWREITRSHAVGAHSFHHVRVQQMGPARFAQDLARTKSALEDVSGKAVLSYRAPYFSASGCDPWFGEVLARAGILIDSSHRIARPPRDFCGTSLLSGSSTAVTEIPLPSIGIGTMRITVIGGTSFRLLPLKIIRTLLLAVERMGFIPMIYLHPYDIDPTALPLDIDGVRDLRRLRLGDRMRRAGRASAAAKLRALNETYEFVPVESILQENRSVAVDPTSLQAPVQHGSPA